TLASTQRTSRRCCPLQAILALSAPLQPDRPRGPLPGHPRERALRIRCRVGRPGGRLLLPGKEVLVQAVGGAGVGTARAGLDGGRRVVSALFFFPRGGSAHVARALCHGLAPLGWRTTLVAGSLGRPGAATN